MLTSSIDSSVYAKYRVESLNSFDYSLKGEFASAMMLNSIIQCAALKYSIEPVSTAMAEGSKRGGDHRKRSGGGGFVSRFENASKSQKSVARGKQELQRCRDYCGAT